MAFVFIRTSSRHVLTLLMGTKMALKQSRQRQLLHRGGSGSYVAGCCVALGCPSWAMTSRLCMTHSQSQTCLVLSKPLGLDGPASVFQQLRRKNWECQDLCGLVSDDLSASFYTIKGPRRQKCRSSRRGTAVSIQRFSSTLGAASAHSAHLSH